MKISFNELIGSQSWYLHSMDSIAASYCEMDEASFAASPFLDGRIIRPKDGRKFKVRINDLANASYWQENAPLAPSRYILHISHVGSTLLSRILGFSPTCLALREPMSLRFLAQRLQDNDSISAWDSPQTFDSLLDFAIQNLGRPLAERSHVVVKCTSWVNPLAEHFLSKSPGVPKRVVGAYVDLSNFVANTLKGGGGLQDMRANAQNRIRRLQNFLPKLQKPLYNLNWGEIAAMSWLCEMLTIRAVCHRTGADLMWVNFDEFMQAPEDGARHLAQHLDLAWDESVDQLLVQSGVLVKYSKSDQQVTFSNAQRQQALTKFRLDNAPLVASALAWLYEVVHADAELAEWLDLERGTLRV